MNEIRINKEWFERLIVLYDRYENSLDQKELNLQLLLGYVSSARFIVNKLTITKDTILKPLEHKCEGEGGKCDICGTHFSY